MKARQVSAAVRLFTSSALIVVAVAACTQHDAARDVTGPASLRMALLGDPLSTFITGPDSARVGDMCTWASNPAGGTPPYTYQWHMLSLHGTDSGTDSTFTVTAVSGNMSIRLSVTDANQATAKDSRLVYTSSTAPRCPINPDP